MSQKSNTDSQKSLHIKWSDLKYRDPGNGRSFLFFFVVIKYFL